MPTIKYKTYFRSLIVAVSALAVAFLCAAMPVSAAAKGGTCVLTVNQGQAAHKVATCKSFMPSGKDATGKKFKSNQCYALDEVRGSVNISQQIACSDSRLTTTSTKAYCPDSSPAPYGDTSKCTAAHGGTYHVGTGKVCGGGTDSEGKPYTPVPTSINFGCSGKGNPIIDLTFAIIRFLSNGVGLVVVGSIVFAGIQYTVSRADPQAVAAAQERIRSSVIALIIYIFAYAILNYVIPKGFLHQ